MALSPWGREPCPGTPPGRGAQAADPLLADAAGVIPVLPDAQVVASGFGQHDRGLYLFGVIVQQPAGAVVPLAGLLVRGRGEHHRAPERHPLPFEQQHHHQLDGHHVLHVEGSAPPDAAVVEIAAERVARPLVRLGGDHVGVAEQKQGRFRAPGVEAGRDVSPARRRFRDQRLEPLPPQDAGDVPGRLGFVAGRIGGVDAQQVLQVTGDFVCHGIPVDHPKCLSIVGVGRGLRRPCSLDGQPMRGAASAPLPGDMGYPESFLQWLPGCLGACLFFLLQLANFFGSLKFHHQ